MDRTWELDLLILSLQAPSKYEDPAIFCFLPDPFGSLRVLLKLKSPPLDCFKLIRRETSTDSSNFVLQFFFTKSKISFVDNFLSFSFN